VRRSRLLVVDDNRLNRLLPCRALELTGHEVEAAVDAREALESRRGALRRPGSAEKCFLGDVQSSVTTSYQE
jgi:CheY-like chemotaxis protein